MNSLYTLIAILLVISQRSYASYPAVLHGYPTYLPYTGAVAVPAPVLHSAPTFYPMHYVPPQREFRNIAGAIKRENELLTDVSIRVPVKNALKNS